MKYWDKISVFCFEMWFNEIYLKLIGCFFYFDDKILEIILEFC